MKFVELIVVLRAVETMIIEIISHVDFEVIDLVDGVSTHTIICW
jgi:hypothetical protein